jgi:hypothetical protein
MIIQLNFKERNVKQVLFGGRGMERSKEGEYGQCTMHTCMKIEQ